MRFIEKKLKSAKINLVFYGGHKRCSEKEKFVVSAEKPKEHSHLILNMGEELKKLT
jgi:hypothetical protein